jgi:hypothetical protein
MKILHAVLSQGFYGSERHCIELATAQAIAGHDVEVLIHDGSSYCARAFRDGIEAATAAIAAKHGPGDIRLAFRTSRRCISDTRRASTPTATD